MPGHHFDARTVAVKASVKVLDCLFSNPFVVHGRLLLVFQLSTDLFQVGLKLVRVISLLFSTFGGSSRLFFECFHVSLHARDSGLQ